MSSRIIQSAGELRDFSLVMERIIFLSPLAIRVVLVAAALGWQENDGRHE
jgi:hypothetical protein